MKVQIKELGIIEEATIDLSKKINVFCGPNGTGKTYMAYALYALTKLRNKNIGIRMEKNIRKQLIEDNNTVIEIDYKVLNEFRKGEVERVKENLGDLFSIPESQADRLFKKTKINILDTNEESFRESIKNLYFEEKEFIVFGYVFKLYKESGKNEIKISILSVPAKDEAFQEFLEIIFLSRLYSILAFYPITSSAIFPVERNSVYTFSNELSIRRNDALDHLQAATNRDKNFNILEYIFKRTTRYPQPIRDSLEIAEDLNNIQKRNSQYYNFAIQMEEELLGGNISINKEGSVDFLSKKAPKTKLSFHQSSSIVKTLASFLIYLKHVANKNDLIIIDEPEMNLHADNQIKLARIFAKLANEGLRFIISTHSDFFVREFNNLIMVGELRKKEQNIADDYKYSKNEYLDKDDIGVCFFSFNSENSLKANGKAVKIDEFGFEVSSLDKTMEELNERAEALYFNLKRYESK